MHNSLELVAARAGQKRQQRAFTRQPQSLGLSRATTQLSDMLRGQSFRAFGLTPKSRDSISEAEVAVEEGDVTDRVGSIGAKVKRQASQRASLQKSATERLQELYL